MRINRHRVIAVLVGFLFVRVLTSVSAQEEDLVTLLDKIADRVDSYPENDSWKYTIVTKATEMNKQWQPTKTTITTIVVKDTEGVMSGEVLEAVEIEDGKTRDIIEEFSEQAKKQLEETNRQRKEQKDQDEPEDLIETLFPFKESKRGKFRFRRLNDASINENPVFVIEAAAIEKDEQLFEGEFYIDQKKYDVLKAHIKPSENPTFVKELDMDIDFEVLSEGNYIRKRSKTRINGGPFFKRVRAVYEEEYSDIEILN